MPHELRRVSYRCLELSVRGIIEFYFIYIEFIFYHTIIKLYLNKNIGVLQIMRVVILLIDGGGIIRLKQPQC